MLTEADVSASLVGTGEIVVLGPGQVALSGRPLQLVEFFDGAFAASAHALGAVDYSFPTLLPLEDADRFGILESFGHLATFVSGIRAGDDAVLAMLDDRRHGDGDGAVGDWLAPAAHLLTTAVCYQLYRSLAGRQLPGELIATSCGSSYRIEAAFSAALARLWEFHMREIVTIASPRRVSRTGAQLRDVTVRFARHLGLAPKVVPAVDPFFTAARGKALVQRMRALKHELVLPLGAGSTIAVASFNRHETFFSSAASFSLAGAARTTTGCVAFGLERWVLAFLCRHGLDESQWPECVRQGGCSHVPI